MPISPFTPDDIAVYEEAGFWQQTTLYEMFIQTARKSPERMAVIDPPNRPALIGGNSARLTYRELSGKVDQFAEALRSYGLGAGDLIATQLPNVHELLALYLAVAKIGAVLSPISMAYRGAELESSNALVDFDAYVSVGTVSGKPFMQERLSAFANDIAVIGIGSDLPQNVSRLDDEVERQPSPPHPASANDLFAVFWTSGTEGVPKAVPKTHNNMMASGLGAWRLLHLPEGTNILAPFPFVNAAAMGGLMMCWMRTEGALIFHHPFSADIFVEQLCSEEVGYTMVAPTILTYLRDRAGEPEFERALKRLLALGTGSAPPDPQNFVFFEKNFDIQVVNFFGSNEGAQLCSSHETVEKAIDRAKFFPRDGDINWQEGKGRRTANGGTFKLVNPATHTPVTELGQIGEMMISGPALMPGYLSRKGFDRSKFDENGFFPTADLFEIAEGGNLIRFHSRARELIVRGGMKISPVELDNFLSALPGIREVAVAPYKDEVMGEKVCVAVVPEGDSSLQLKDVTDFCNRGGLAKFKWPERLETLSKLPRTPLQKLDRKALAKMLEELA